MNDVTRQLRAVKEASYEIQSLSEQTRKQVLLDFAAALRQNIKQILVENARDLALMDKSSPKYDRLLLTEQRITAIADDVVTVASLPHADSVVLGEKILANGLILRKVSVPLGVVAVIYESRPNVTADVFTLCFKAGNACVLKGGKEAFYSSHYLVSLIQDTLKKHGLNEHFVYLLPTDKSATKTLLAAIDCVDVCIPRGSQALIDFVREHATIPVIETGAGIVHTFFDASADLAKGRAIIHNAKTRRVSVCNALDTLIIHQQRLQDLPELVSLLADKQVILYADHDSFAALQGFYPDALLNRACREDYGHEFLDYKMSIKTVASLDEALLHIKTWSSGHSEAIIAEDAAVQKCFLEQVDAAAVYVNASTSFTDGGQFGMGAEIGISTQKLHARGPMALEALSTYKWHIIGDGQTRE